jgi:ABC-type glycerol-3-phosphate transport system substrate-binding protein
MSGVSRRTVLRAGAAGAVVSGAGCGTSDRATQVVVIWSADELAQFRRVLQRYPHAVEVVSAGDDIDAFLRARHRAGTSPDVAVLSRPGLVTEYARRGWLSELDGHLAEPFGPPWSELLRVDGKLYGAWVKAAYKSLFWYQPSMLAAPPSTWEELVALVRDRGAAPGPAPLAIGAADGWVLTDWFENLLAATAPTGFYDALARGVASWQEPPVRDVLQLLADVWSLPGAFPGGGRRALLTQFDASVIQVISGRAATVFEADFVERVVSGFRSPGAPPLATFHFPSVNGVSPVVVGGDAAVALAGSARGVDLVAWLTGPEAFQPWIEAGGYLSPNRHVPSTRYPPGLIRQIITELHSTTGAQFGLSDQLPGTFGGTDGVGSWRIMQDFFGAVATGAANPADRAAAIEHTMRQFTRAAKDAGSGL